MGLVENAEKKNIEQENVEKENGNNEKSENVEVKWKNMKGTNVERKILKDPHLQNSFFFRHSTLTYTF